MENKRAHPEVEDVHYKKLDTIDTKCGSLLTMTSILLVFISLPPLFEKVRPDHVLWFRIVFLSLLTSCLIALFVLFFKERAGGAFVELRKTALNIAVGITGICCIIVMIIVAASL